MGSCFSENIGAKLEYFQFQQTTNPFGIIFDPVSNFSLLDRALDQRMFEAKDIFQRDDTFFTFEAHSSVFAEDADTLVDKLNAQLLVLRSQLLASSHLILTFGSAWVFRHRESSEIVANCHKIPQGEFSKEILSVDQISEVIQNSLLKLMQVNPKLQIICTVSPVRHIRHGIVENSRSKAHLLAAVYESIEKHSQWHYFPSFELMMDELRDYRFYDPDLLHPSSMAIDIIWDRFASVWIDDETQSLREKIAGIRQGLAHRPLHPNSTKHQEFLRKLQLQIDEVKQQLPYVNFS